MVALMTIASKLIDKTVIINITIRETVITLFARARCRAIPVGSWMLPRDTFPLNRMPGIEADNPTESATGVLQQQRTWADLQFISLAWEFRNTWRVSSTLAAAHSFAGVVIRSRKVVS